MAFGKGNATLDFNSIKLSDAQILAHYLGITKVPCLISSPLRKDSTPSMGFYSKNGKKIYWKDFGTNQSGGVFDLLSLMWGCSLREAAMKAVKEVGQKKAAEVSAQKAKSIINPTISSDTKLSCKVRKWLPHDKEYWESYGVPIDWLVFAEVYPISHKIVIKDGKKFVFGADKYAYAFVERKEGNITLKIYQPFNKQGFKWANKHDRSVIGLWTKIPETGDKLVICSSLKDALCLWANTGIPTVCVQGEGYTMSKTAVNQLKQRFKKVFVCYDNDSTGLVDGEKIAKTYGFTNVVLPQFDGGKDISDFMHLYGKEKFNQTITPLFK